jgi:hypothetical protein
MRRTLISHAPFSYKLEVNMNSELLQRLQIPVERIKDLNTILLDMNEPVISHLMAVVARYGTPAEINQQAAAARQLPNLLQKVAATQPKFLPDLEWLHTQCQKGAFISVANYRRKVLGPHADQMTFQEASAVTLEISALQYFPWIMAAARRAVQEEMLMPGRWIQVRKMKEQETDGDLPAILAALDIIGASHVATLDTKGTDGSNVHLGGAATLTGYFGGVGEPNDYPLRWADELLYYYTRYGVRQVLNLNPGTVLVGYLLNPQAIEQVADQNGAPALSPGD